MNVGYKLWATIAFWHGRRRFPCLGRGTQTLSFVRLWVCRFVRFRGRKIQTHLWSGLPCGLAEDHPGFLCVVPEPLWTPRAGHIFTHLQIPQMRCLALSPRTRPRFLPSSSYVGERICGAPGPPCKGERILYLPKKNRIATEHPAATSLTECLG